MEAENSFISVDWGTSNLRIRFVSNPDFQILDEYSFDYGLKKINIKWEKSKNIFPTKKIIFLKN